ncbi:MAG: hypothetical protein HY787_14070 [Deltaproteobacteria bacterium]|nr:hypothetical protein [Deltaproteobacteria bacterium]
MRKLLLILILPWLACVLDMAKSGFAETITPSESERILERIFNKYMPIYEKYRGVESTSRVISREFDPKTNVLKRTSEVFLHRKDYFYEKPEIKALSLKIEGKDTDPSQYRSWETKPAYLVFDKKGRENYQLKTTEKKNIGQKECYRIEVLPRKSTSRHFKGEIYCTVDSLNVVQTVGGVGDLEFPIKYFWSDFYYTLIKEIPVVQSGTLKIRVNLPILYPDTLIVTSTTILESKLME